MSTTLTPAHHPHGRLWNVGGGPGPAADSVQTGCSEQTRNGPWCLVGCDLTPSTNRQSGATAHDRNRGGSWIFVLDVEPGSQQLGRDVVGYNPWVGSEDRVDRFWV